MDANLLDQYIMPWGIRIIAAIAIFIIGKWAAKIAVTISKSALKKSGQDNMLIQFLGNILYTVLLAAVVIAALDQLGVQTTSLLAVLAAAGLAVGLALKDSLANFSSGVMIIIFRPFKDGDYIEAGGTAGTVEHIGIFSTVMRTGDNRKIIVPNSEIFGSTIVNISANPTRRVDLSVGIGYNEDIKKVKQVLLGIMEKDDRIFKDPAASVTLAELADSSINFNVRPWVKSGDYWAVRESLLEAIITTFDEQNISIPYPQQDVHIHQVA
jgi:small conductance mechanosensitive channel